MLRFAEMLAQALPATGWEPEIVRPTPFWGGRGRSRYLAYLDKFGTFPPRLRRTIRRAARDRATPLVVHICDHGNAMYASDAGPVPVLTTCHDLLAVRAALGEETDCAGTQLGVRLQRWIVQGLARAQRVACCSQATLADAERLIPRTAAGPYLSHIPLGLNFPYRPISDREAAQRLAKLVFAARPYLLHVGSNHRRKNRGGVLRIFAHVAAEWPGDLVFAGEPLSAELRALAISLGIAKRVHDVARPDNLLLEALYNRATALLFPSRFEGFGWPLIEAQACGCPVIAAATGPLPEVVGEGGQLCAVEDEAAFARAVLRVAQPEQHREWSRRSLENARHYTTARMAEAYAALYREMAGPEER
jgi:glycosyltransferase involved in cell wall biosynthesis